MIYEIVVGDKTYKLTLQKRDGRWVYELDNLEVTVDALAIRPDVLSILVGGKVYEIQRERQGGEIWIWLGGIRHRVEVSDPRSLRGQKRGSSGEKGPVKITAPMPGKVVRVLVVDGSEVEKGQGVIVIEAMKMQNEIKSHKKGTVRKLSATVGAAVNAGDVLAIVE